MVACVSYDHNMKKRDNFWTFKAVKLHQHSNQVFCKHADSLRHKAAEKKKLKSKVIIYKQMCDYDKKAKPRKKRPNMPSHKKDFQNILKRFYS